VVAVLVERVLPLREAGEGMARGGAGAGAGAGPGRRADSEDDEDVASEYPYVLSDPEDASGGRKGRL
jgi:hypothetical protein